MSYIRRSLMALLAVMLAGPSAWSQPLELEIGNDWRVEGSYAANDGGLWLLTSVEQTRMYRRYKLTRITPDLAIEYERWMPPTHPRGIVAFRDGILTIATDDRPADFRSNPDFEDSYRLTWMADDPAALPETLFSWQSADPPTMHEPHAVAPDQSAIYLMSAQRSEPAIVRLGPDGTVQWRRDLGTEQFQALTATPEGAVALLYGRQGYRLVAISTAGDPLWDMELTVTGSLSEFDFVPPRTLVIETRPPDDELQRLELVDIGERTRRTVTVPSNDGRILPVAGGFLYAGGALDNGLVAFIREDGRIEWAQRLQFGFSIAQALGQNSVAMFNAAYDNGRISRVWFERSALDPPALTERYGKCLEADAAPIVDRERHILRDYGMHVPLRSTVPRETRPVDDRGCALPGEAGYLRFLDDFSAELMRLGAGRYERYSEHISIAVDELDVPYRLRFYGFQRPISDGAGTDLRYIAEPGSGQALARHLASAVAPHLQRMRLLSRAFYDDWRCGLYVDPGSMDLAMGEADRFFAGLEEAGSLIVEAASRIEPPIPPEGNGGFCGSLESFDEDSFSIGGEEGPVSAARRILRDFVNFRQE